MFSFCSCSDDGDEPKAKPSKMSITSVTVKKFPSVDKDNNDWNGALSGTHPDVYFIIGGEKEGTVYRLPTEDRIENLRNADLPSTFTSSNPFYTFTDLDQGFNIGLYDFDSFSEDDYIGGVRTLKTLADYGSETPEFIDLIFGDFNFRVNVDWVY